MKKSSLLFLMFFFFIESFAQYGTSTYKIDYGDYTFFASNFFKKEIDRNVIRLTEPSEYGMNISVSQPFPSSGDMNVDLDNYYDLFFTKNNWVKSNDMFAGEDKIEKGITSNGYEYLLLFRDVKAAGGYENAEEKSCCIILMKLGNEVGIILGTHKTVSGAFQYAIYENLQNQFILMLQTFKSKKNPAKQNVIPIKGTWSAVSSSTASEFTFHLDGTFSNGAAASTRIAYSETHDKVTTTSWANDGTWKYIDNVFTLYYPKTKKSNIGSLRYVQEKLYDGTWSPLKIGWFDFFESGSIGEVKYTID